MRAGRLLAALPLIALALAACQSEEAIPSGRDIVSTIPWTAPEEARYRLVDGDEVKGSGLLRIESRDGRFSFTQEFENEEFRNEVLAVADGETMRPQSVRYVIDGPKGTREWQVEYDDHAAVVVQRSGDDERRDKVALPASFYDSWTDVFVWRTIDFQEGFETRYADVLSATLAKPKVISQTVKVTGKETVEVPAGTFQAWRLEIRSSGGKQKAWYADTETRPLVRYDNGDLVFELVSIE